MTQLVQQYQIQLNLLDRRTAPTKSNSLMSTVGHLNFSLAKLIFLELELEVDSPKINM